PAAGIGYDPAMRVHAFRGYRFSTGAGDPGRLAAPPFDQIDPALAERLRARSPHQFAHLTRPAGDSSGERARRAAALHGEWLRAGAVIRDPRPALYLYDIELADGGRRLGLCCLVGIEPPGSDRIRPHEHTVAKTVAERLELLETLRVDLEPIFLLSDDPGSLERLLREECERARPVAEHEDPDGHRHRISPIDDPDRIGAYQEALDGVGSVIADGHHRYRVAQLYAEQSGARADAAAGAKLVVVTSVRSPGVTIDPIHRLLPHPFDPAPESGVVARRGWEGRGGGAFAAAVAAAEQPARGVWRSGARPEIWRLDPRQGPAHLAPAASRLSVVLFHDPLLKAAGYEKASATDGTVLYRSDPEELWAAVAADQGATGFWLPPMPADAFAAAVAQGDLLPPKSTRFLPKLASGLVWCGHDTEIA
ncbi:MAG: DUF1015 domain-containing protein, partial [Thermoanaerobaculia bacterium]|nr:DUF1015 domain-containing protein [Thermoanaerobaculia bacterium]